MDAHFNEYLAAVAGMAEIYGEPDVDRHDASDAAQAKAACQRVDSTCVFADPCIWAG
jgi:hypothetical protein